MKVEEEVWKDIKGYEGRYQISSLGRVKSLSIPSGFGVHSKDSIRKIEKVWTGYLRICLKGRKKYVHVLVAENFLENPLSLPSVNHRDGNKQNNTLENLEWVSRSDNTKHAYGLGLLKKKYGLENPQCKYSEDLIKEVMTRLGTGDRGIDISRELGISRSYISQLKKGTRLRTGTQK